MVFSSVQFIFVFFPLVLAAYTLAPRWAKNAVLLAFSLVFYAWGGVRYILLILASIGVNYLVGLGLETVKKAPGRRALLTLGILFDLGLLGYFKYYDFFAGAISPDLVRGIVLPIGISFYTFQAMSYIIDLYRGQISVQRNPIRFALYIALFPQLIAGPIVRYKDIEAQMGERTVTADDFCYGIQRFVLGLGKKALLANPLGSVFTNITAARPEALPWTLLVFAYVLYSLQLYYDFSGYSDMAIGLGRMFGFTFPENFNYPYLSKSIGEFWRRWHITLSDWFKNYVYIPLGGNRRGALRTTVNLWLVFVLTGLWHGAAWQFLAFGAYHGFFLVLERRGLGKWLNKNALVGHCYALTVILFGFVIFGANGLRMGLASWKGILTLQAGDGAYRLAQFLDGRILLILILAVVLSGPVQLACKPLRKALIREKEMSLPMMAALSAVLFLSIMAVTASNYNPFIYFRF